jgi:hypothetical protein
MKKGFSICLLVITVVFLATSCGGSPAARQDNLPPWLNDVPGEDVLWGIGSAKQSTIQLSRTAAEARARTSIARTLQVKVENMFTDYNRDAGTPGEQASLTLVEEIGRQITSMQLNGARPIQQWQAPDGTWWFLVEMQKADAKASVDQMFHSEAARYAEFKTDEALRMLDSQLARQEKPIPVYE